MNERLNNAVIEEFMDLMDFGHSKMESYKRVAEHWDLSQSTVRRIVTKTLNKTLNNSSETLNNSSETLNNSSETLNKTLNNDTASGQCFTSAQIVENICSKAKCKNYTKSFEKLNASGQTLSNRTTLWF